MYIYIYNQNAGKAKNKIKNSIIDQNNEVYLVLLGWHVWIVPTCKILFYIIFIFYFNIILNMICIELLLLLLYLTF